MDHTRRSPQPMGENVTVRSSPVGRAGDQAAVAGTLAPRMSPWRSTVTGPSSLTTITVAEGSSKL